MKHVGNLSNDPILNWTRCEIWEYIGANSLPTNPMYKYFDRIGCWCCPFKTDEEWRQVKELFPDKAQRFEEALLDFAKKMNIKDTDMFVNGRGWTRWARARNAYTPPMVWSLQQSTRRCS